MKILVLRLSSMGDVILVTSLFTYIKKHYPHAEIGFITNKLYSDLFVDDPRLSFIVPYLRGKEQDQFADIQSRSWDIGIDLQNNRRSKMIRRTYFPNVNFQIFKKLHLKRFLLISFRLNFYTSKSNVVERYIDTVRPIFKSQRESPPIKLYFNANIVKKIVFPEFENINKPILALFPFCAWKNKQWLLSSYAEVGSYFLKKNWNILILGGPDDKREAEKLKNLIGQDCLSLAGKLNLYKIGSILKLCKLALGNDTGLSHLARSCGVKIGIIYGATTHHFGFYPFGKPPFKIFQSQIFCRPCHPHGGDFCWRIFRPCLKNLKARCVIKGLEELLKE